MDYVGKLFEVNRGPDVSDRLTRTQKVRAGIDPGPAPESSAKPEPFGAPFTI